MTKKLTYFCIGAIVSSLSWFILLFLYANIDSIEIKPRADGNLNSGFQDMLNAKNLIAIRNPEPLHHKPKLQYYEELKDNIIIRRVSNRNKGLSNESLNGNSMRLKEENPLSLGESSAKKARQVIEGEYDSPSDAAKIRTSEDQLNYDKGISHHAFNEYLSTRLSFHRPIPNTNDPRCASITYNILQLPSASLVICFYNEALSVLLRTLHSVVSRTPSSLVKEIILVDDYSDSGYLKDTLATYCEEQFGDIIKIVRNRQREGLMRSRMAGARLATGDVLIFLDSHVEVNVGWMEPLLQRVMDISHIVVMPIIDMIDADTFEYIASPLVRGGFTWSLHFSWEPIPSELLHSTTDPLYIETPTMAGGLFAMNREYFFKLGGYDEGMDIWGGENLEMSFRTWMCGGKMEISLCSHVGHIFRDKRPYSSPTGENTFVKNSLRVANVWLDDYKSKFYSTNNKKYDNINYGDVSSRVSLRSKLECQDFSWYITKIYNPDVKTSPVKSNKRKGDKISVISKGRMIHSNTGLCLATKGDAPQIRSSVILASCKSQSLKWYQTDKQSYMIGNNFCLDVIGGKAIVDKCTNSGGTQKWLIEKQHSRSVMYNPGTGQCLGVKTMNSGDMSIIIQSCETAPDIIYQS